MGISYTDNIGNIDTRLKEKATEFERGIEQQISEATRKLKIKIGEEIKGYQEEIIKISKGKIPLDYVQSTFGIPTRVEERLNSINKSLMEHELSNLPVYILPKGLQLVFGERNHDVSDETNRINTLNGYNVSTTSLGYEALEKHPWMSKNKGILNRLSMYGLENLASRKMGKEEFISFLNSVRKDVDVHTEVKEQAKAMIEDTEKTPYQKKGKLEELFPGKKIEKMERPPPSEHFYGQDFTNH